MADTSSKVIEGLINKAFENLGDRERLDFIEDMFSSLPSKSQQAIVLEMIKGIGASSDGPSTHRPHMIRLEMLDDALQDNGPWRMCCNMMLDIDKAEDFNLLDAAKPTRLFNALGDETRIKIIKLLSDGELPVDGISKELAIAQPTVSHHLKILREAELLNSDKRGRSVFYSLTRPIKVSFA